jgi:hypothetical protein
MTIDEIIRKYPAMDTAEMRAKLEDKRLVKYVTKRIRQVTPRGEKQPCYVCGKYRHIAHLHHPFPVEDIMLFVLFYGLYDAPLYIPTVWLCPNHHALYHLVQDTQGMSKEALEGVGHDELVKFSEIEQMVTSEKIREMIQGVK